MTKRYDAIKMTPEQFQAAEASTHFGGESLAWLLATRFDRVKRWERGEEEVPHYVTLIMGVLDIPEARERLLAISRAMVATREQSPPTALAEALAGIVEETK